MKFPKIIATVFLSCIGLAVALPAQAFEITSATWDGKKLILAARVSEPTSDRVMEVLTTEPGMQFYTSRGEAFCLETQHFPDSPNKPEFPSTILRPGEIFKSETIYKFSTK